MGLAKLPIGYLRKIFNQWLGNSHRSVRYKKPKVEFSFKKSIKSPAIISLMIFFKFEVICRTNYVFYILYTRSFSICFLCFTHSHWSKNKNLEDLVVLDQWWDKMLVPGLKQRQLMQKWLGIHKGKQKKKLKNWFLKQFNKLAAGDLTRLFNTNLTLE